jgi:phage-related protein (TIGR01555 family)
MTAPTGRPRGRPRKDAAAPRIDGPYENVILGVGGRNDRSSLTRIAAGRILSAGELDVLYAHDGFARRIIDTPADEMVRAGFELEGVDESGKVTAALEGLAVASKLGEALRWAGLYGGALVVMVINDGGTLDDPLRPDSVREVESLRVYDRWQVSRHKHYTDAGDKRFGEVEVYLISPAIGSPYYVHASRCLAFDGQPVPPRIREQNDGWGGSLLQAAYDQLQRLNMAHEWASKLRQRGGEDLVRKRIDMVDMARSVSNTVVIDAAESYDIKATSFASVPDIVDRMAGALAAVANMPESLLFGKQRGGLGSDNAGDLKVWHAHIGQQQETRLLPQLDRLVGLVLRSLKLYTEAYEIEFCPLAVASEKERSEVSLNNAKAAEIYVSMQALDPSEVRATLIENGPYQMNDTGTSPETGDVEDDRS